MLQMLLQLDGIQQKIGTSWSINQVILDLIGV